LFAKLVVFDFAHRADLIPGATWSKTTWAWRALHPFALAGSAVKKQHRQEIKTN
jgi:hypothetical protein